MHAYMYTHANIPFQSISGCPVRAGHSRLTHTCIYVHTCKHTISVNIRVPGPSTPKALIHSGVCRTSINMCACIYMYIYIYIYTHTHLHTCMNMCVYIYIHTHAYMYTYHFSQYPGARSVHPECVDPYRGVQDIPGFFISL